MSPTPTTAFSYRSAGSDLSERRLRPRYAIHLNVEYEVLDGMSIRHEGHGRTVNISRTGVLVQAQDRVTAGNRIELSIQWPCQLKGSVPLKLVVRGDIVRNKGNLIAVEIKWHEFRTAGLTKTHTAA